MTSSKSINKVELIALTEEDPLLLREPAHILNEIISSVNNFVDNNPEDNEAILYLGSAQNYALKFMKNTGVVDPMKGTFSGIPMIHVDQRYHLNLVQVRRNAEG